MQNISKETISRIKFLEEERLYDYQHGVPFKRLSRSEFQLVINEMWEIYRSLDIPEIRVEVSDGNKYSPELILERIKILPENIGILRDCGTGVVYFQKGEEALEVLARLEMKMKENLEKISENLNVLQAQSSLKENEPA